MRTNRRTIKHARPAPTKRPLHTYISYWDGTKVVCPDILHDFDVLPQINSILTFDYREYGAKRTLRLRVTGIEQHLVEQENSKTCVTKAIYIRCTLLAPRTADFDV